MTTSEGRPAPLSAPCTNVYLRPRVADLCNRTVTPCCHAAARVTFPSAVVYLYSLHHLTHLAVRHFDRSFSNIACQGTGG